MNKPVQFTEADLINMIQRQIEEAVQRVEATSNQANQAVRQLVEVMGRLLHSYEQLTKEHSQLKQAMQRETANAD